MNPVIFADGVAYFEELGQKYRQHDQGLFILAPSGVGKTHFCKEQAEPHWIDGDDLWIGAKAHPDGPWWTEPLEVIDRVDQRSDVITMEAKHMGFWTMGASNSWLRPDAIVIPDWERHKELIGIRQKTNYDGGATLDRLEQVQSHIEFIRRWKKEGVPEFKSIEEAVKALTQS